MSIVRNEDELPRTTRNTLIVGVAIAISGLALHEPAIIGAAIAGVLVGVSVVGLTGCPERATLGAAILPLGLSIAVGLVGVMITGVTISTLGGNVVVSSSVYSGVAAVVATLLGAGVVGTVTNSVSHEAASRALLSAFVGALTAAGLVGFSLSVTTPSSTESIVQTVTYTTGGSWGKLVAAIMLSAQILVFSAYATPAAAISSPGNRNRIVTMRRQFLLATVLVTGSFIALIWMLQSVGADWVVTNIFNTVVVRLLLTACSALGLGITVAALFVRISWHRKEDGQNPDAGIIVGTIMSVTVIIGGGILLGASAEQLFLVPTLLVLAGLSIWLGVVFADFNLTQKARQELPAVLGALCLVGALAVGASVGGTATLGRSELGTVLALSGGLFTYAIGQYGTTVTAEVGGRATMPEPQLVHVAYVGSVIIIGMVLAVVGYLCAMFVAPTFSLPSTVGLVSALVATVGLLRFLRR
ncbi:hypothetical protein ACFQJ7_16040 [Halovenus rubra]|uniref:Uncharacterized protein n=2 Tax=Halovenus rubra TaxID=869890 RepID=A0ABD5X8D4_9EURY|nr:hypothetical protein [Halovenus rubra]